MIAAEDRLSLLDRFFLAAEGASAPMHIGAVLVLEAGPLARGRRHVDVPALRDHVASRLHRVPRFRQRLAWTPLEGRAFWIDDDRFELGRHVRHLRLRDRGDDAALRRVAGEILALPLDPERPLWELWIVDGLSGGRFAVVTKTHHCMVDGIGGVEQLAALLDPDATAPAEVAPPWTPRRAPRRASLAAEEATSLVADGAARLADLGRSLLRPGETWTSIAPGLRALADAGSASLTPPQATPINGRLGPRRRVEWLTMPLAELKVVRHRLGGTLNDVVLATVAGGLRRYLRTRGVPLEGREIRAAVPVSVRGAESSGGNQVSLWLVPLPVAERDPEARLGEIRGRTGSFRSGGNARALYSVLGWLEGVSPFWLHAGVRLLETQLPFNVIVTNVPGPPIPLYLHGARLLAGYPSVPLFENQGLGIALFSYDGNLHWGFNADPGQVPDLESFVYAVAASFTEFLERAVPTAVPGVPDGVAEEPGTGVTPEATPDLDHAEA